MQNKYIPYTNKNKNHIIISIDMENTLDKVQYSFMIKTAKKIGIEGTYLNRIKAESEKPIANIILNGEKQNISSKIKTNQDVHSHHYYSTCFRSPSLGNQRRKKKGIQTGKEVKLSFFADDMILYIENLKDVTRKILELTNEFGKFAGYKINTQKSHAFI